MSQAKNKLKFELYDTAGANIEAWMNFKVSNDKKIEAGEWISLEWTRLRKWKKFKLHDDFRLKKRVIQEDDAITMEGGEKFHFNEDDVIHIDKSENSEGGRIVTFHVERDGAKVESKDGESVSFTMDVERFLDIFEDHTEIEIEYLNKFKFKPRDTIVVEDTYVHEKENDQQQERKVIKFIVKRDGEVVVDDRGEVIVFEFNASIFTQRFERVTDVLECLAGTNQQVRELLELYRS